MAKYAPNNFQFKEFPAQITCPVCRATITTDTSYKSGIVNWLVCAGISLAG